MTRHSSDLEARLKKIAMILVEESVASYLPYQFGVTLEKEAATIEIVRASPNGAADLPGYLIGAAPGADPASLARAAQRIIEEVP
ncbi:MAG: hypothetical protein Q8K82_15575 [Gemmatimonadaceae bacterium]|nr:hypothetical protein [Gemmatimonadaceae bacterium]